jgi:tetratricopeptide (TPR) repeat protein
MLTLIAAAVSLAGLSLATGRARPEDPCLTYNRGCSCASADELPRATELFSQVALAENEDLAARAHHNLGTIAARRARAILGDDPVEAPPERRQEGLTLLKQAMAHYRDSLERAPYQSDSRYNLELIRLWIRHMETLWGQRDSRDRRRQMSLLEMLDDLQSRQRELRAQNLALAAQPDTVERQRMARQLADVQNLLSEETDTLREKLVRELDEPGAVWPERLNVVSFLSTTMEESITELSDLADEAQQEMATAVEQLREGPLEEAAVHQALAVELIDEIHLALVPFFPLVSEAVQSQRRLIELVTQAAAPGAGAGKESDLQEAAWDQQFVARWCQLLPDKAEQSLRILQRMGAAEEQEPGGTSDAATDLSPLGELTRCMEKAVEVAPKVQDLTDQAAADLSEQKLAVALPKQQEALSLLEQILALVPERARQTSQDRQAPSHSAGKPPQNHEPSPGSGSERHRSAKESAGRAQPPRQGDLSARHVEAMARQVRERQRQRRVLEREFQHGQSQALTVEKDW